MCQTLLCCFYCFAPNIKVFQKILSPFCHLGRCIFCILPDTAMSFCCIFSVCLKFHTSLPRILPIVRTIELISVTLLLFPLRSVSSILQPFYGVQGIKKCGGSLAKVLTTKAVEITITLFRTSVVMILTFLNYKHYRTEN